MRQPRAKRGGDLELLLVFSEKDVEGPSKTPHGEHQEQQEPLHISHHRAQRVHKGVLGWLEHSAEHIQCYDYQRHYCCC